MPFKYGGASMEGKALANNRPRKRPSLLVLVNARHLKNAPGRKSDVTDCEWLRDLHSVGLLRGSFRPDEEIVTLRSYLRHRDTLVQNAATAITRMQKALVQMNLQLHIVI